jgi:hypothetical protein
MIAAIALNPVLPVFTILNIVSEMATMWRLGGLYMKICDFLEGFLNAPRHKRQLKYILSTL